MSKAFSLICLTVEIPASGRKKPKRSGKSLVGANYSFTVGDVFCLKLFTIGSEDKLGFLPVGCWDCF
jgi:hypothetical protein